MNEQQLAHDLAELAVEGVPTAPDLLPRLQTHLAIVERLTRPRRSARPRLVAAVGAVAIIVLVLGLTLAPTASATANQVLGLFGFTAVSVADAHPVCVRGSEQRPPDFVPVNATPFDAALLTGATTITFQVPDAPVPASVTPATAASTVMTSAQMITCPSGYDLHLVSTQK